MRRSSTVSAGPRTSSDRRCTRHPCRRGLSSLSPPVRDLALMRHFETRFSGASRVTASGAAGPVPGRRRMLAGLLALGGCGMCGLAAPVQATVRTAIGPGANAAAREPIALEGFFDDLERRTFNFFWETANPDNGLIPDRFPGGPEGLKASIASVGFGLTAYVIGFERGYISREVART